MYQVRSLHVCHQNHLQIHLLIHLPLLFGRKLRPLRAILTASLANISDSYRIEFVQFGQRVNDFSLFDRAKNSEWIVCSTTIPVVSAFIPPRLTAAYYDTDGITVLAQFDLDLEETDVTSSTGFPCSNIFSFVGSDLAVCGWLNSYTVRIDSSILLLHQNITVKPNVSAARCPRIQSNRVLNCNLVYAEEISVEVLSPSSLNALTPRVTIRGPTVVGDSVPLFLDLSASVGHCGFPWSLLSFDLQDTNADNVTMLESLLQQAASQYLKNYRPIFIDRSYLQNNAYYVLAATLCNVFSQCSTAVYMLRVQATITGWSNRQIPSSFCSFTTDCTFFFDIDEYIDRS
jgi:hypothetical protein